MEGYATPLINNLVIDFVLIVLSLVVIILLLRIVWRVEKQIDHFFKYLTLAFVIQFVKHTFLVLINLEVIPPGNWLLYLDIATQLFVILGLFTMIRVVTNLDNER